jgi:hypothetical protein
MHHQHLRDRNIHQPCMYAVLPSGLLFAAARVDFCQRAWLVICSSCLLAKTPGSMCAACSQSCVDPPPPTNCCCIGGYSAHLVCIQGNLYACILWYLPTGASAKLSSTPSVYHTRCAKGYIRVGHGMLGWSSCGDGSRDLSRSQDVEMVNRCLHVPSLACCCVYRSHRLDPFQ